MSEQIRPGGTGAINATRIKDRLWEARVRWRDDEGAFHRTRARGQSKAECEEEARRRVDAARTAFAAARARKAAPSPHLPPGAPSAAPTAYRVDLTLDQVAQLWLASLKNTRRRPSTIEQYRATWRGALSPVIGNDHINAIDRARIQNVLHEQLFKRQAGRRNPDGSWAPGEHLRDADGELIPLTGAQPRNVMNLVLRYAADRGYRADGHNPLDGTQTPDRVRPTPRALTDAQALRLIEMAEHWHRTGHGAGDVLWHGLVVMYYTGVRIGELLGLTWDDVDLTSDPATVTVASTLLEARGAVPMQLGPTKSGTTDTIALHEAAIEVLRARRKAAKPDAAYVFATRTGRPVSQANFRRPLRNLVQGTDLDWVHPHTFRHTMGTKAARATDDTVARDLLRHTDAAVTRRHYIQDDGRRTLDPRWLF